MQSRQKILTKATKALKSERIAHKNLKIDTLTRVMVARMPGWEHGYPDYWSAHVVESADMPAWLTEQYYTEQIQPCLKQLKVREILNPIKIQPHPCAATHEARSNSGFISALCRGRVMCARHHPIFGFLGGHIQPRC